MEKIRVFSIDLGGIGTHRKVPLAGGMELSSTPSPLSASPTWLLAAPGLDLRLAITTFHLSSIVLACSGYEPWPTG